FVGDLITSALKRPPHVPARDGSIGPPALSKLQQLLRFWHELLAVGYRPALFHSQVVNRQHVGATEIKYEKHLHRPSTDSADRIESLHHFFVAELRRVFQVWHDPSDGFLC